MISKLINQSTQQLHGWAQGCNAKMERAVGKKNSKPMITRRCVIKEETEELGEKPFHNPPS